MVSARVSISLGSKSSRTLALSTNSSRIFLLSLLSLSALVCSSIWKRFPISFPRVPYFFHARLVSRIPIITLRWGRKWGRRRPGQRHLSSQGGEGWKYPNVLLKVPSPNVRVASPGEAHTNKLCTDRKLRLGPLKTKLRKLWKVLNALSLSRDVFGGGIRPVQPYPKRRATDTDN